MPDNFELPASVVHQGKGVYVVYDAARKSYFYNVLELKIDSKSDNDDWNGYRELSLPAQLSPAGMSLVRNTLRPATAGYFQVLSDQQYVYLVRASSRSLYINRYILVGVPSGQTRDEVRFELQPAWEVRYQRSGSPDVPASDKDTLSFVNMENQPFYEPVYELPFGGFNDLSLENGGFCVNFTPTNLDNKLRWQFFVRNSSKNQIYSYSFARSETGWFDFAKDQIDPATLLLLPDAVLNLIDAGGASWSVVGPPAATVYLKQETFTTSNDETLKAKRSARVLLAAQVRSANDPPESSRLATVDFGVAADGQLAFLAAAQPQGTVRPFVLGEVAAAGYTLDFDGAARVDIPTAKPLTLGTTFTLEAWVLPAAKDIDRHGILGGPAGTKPEKRPPSLYLIDRFRVGIAFGDGVVEYATKTVENVLTPGGWTHLAASFDGTTMQLFVNGIAVALEDPAVFAGKVPVATPLGAIGGGNNPFLGTIDEVRVWTAPYSAEIAQYLYKEIAASVAKSLPTLVGYWPLDEGHGTAAADLSQGNRTATLYGATWVASTSPVVPATQPTLSIDERGLSVYAGIIAPSQVHPDFGNIKEGSRPFLLNGADGLIHLYYQGGAEKVGAAAPPTDQFLVAHFDVSMERAYYALPWTAAAADASGTQTGRVLLLTRHAGAAFNHAKIALAGDTSTQTTWTLDDGLKVRETWNGVPRRLTYALSALTGGAVSEPSDPRLKAGDRVFYDYAGGRYLGYVPLGDPLQCADFLFVSRNLSAHYLKQVKVTTGGNSGTLEVRLTVEVGGNGGALVRTLPGVGAAVPVFVQTLEGGNPGYAYDAPPAVGDTRVYGIRTDSEPLLVFVPDPAIAEASFEAKDATSGDPALCDVTISLTPAPGTATWENVPRSVPALIEAIRNSATAPQKAVAAKLHPYSPAAVPSKVVNGRTDADAGSAAFLGLFTLLNEGVAPTVAVSPFTLDLRASQGATSSGQTANLALGSNLFAAVAETLPDNGYPACLDPGSGTLFKPGVDGGWLAEAPRIAVSLSGAGEGLEVDLTKTVGTNPLAIPADFTLEAWVNPALPGEGTRSAREFPRILHAGLEKNAGNDRADVDKPCCMLGLTPTYALQFVKGVRVAASDATVASDLAALRLFPSADFTVQLLVNPNLATITGANRLWSKVSTADSIRSERLELLPNGDLIYTAPTGTGKGNVPLTPRVWSQVTVVRSGATVQIYVDGRSAPPITAAALDAPQNVFTLGGQELEMQVNQVAIWNRALSPAEVAAQTMALLPGDTLGLSLLWRLDDLDTAMRVPNSAITTGPLYDTTVLQPTSPAFWSQPGLFYRAFATSQQIGAETRDPVVLPGRWTHLAAIYDAHFGVTLGEGRYADCGADATLDLQSALTVEAWFQQSATTPAFNQTLLSKMGGAESQKSYELGLDGQNRPTLTVRVLGEKQPNGEAVSDTKKLHTFTAPKPISSGTGKYVAGTMEIVSIHDEKTSRELYIASGQIYVDGAPQLDGPTRPASAPTGPAATYELKVYGGTGSGRYPKGTEVPIAASVPSLFQQWRGKTGPVKEIGQSSTKVTMPAEDVAISAIGSFDALSISVSTTPVNLGRSQPDVAGGRFYFRGTLSDVRLWSAALSPSTIAEAFASRQAPASDKGLVSSWYFEEQTGAIAYDGGGDNNARLSASDLWTTVHFNATMRLLQNGNPVPSRGINYGAVGGYGERQLRFGTMTDDNGALANAFDGTLDEVRVWDVRRTQEQIADNMNRYLAGNEPHLMGYWNFDSGSGRTVVDGTGRGNNAVFFTSDPNIVPQWIESTAPVSDEAPPVRNALGGPRTIQTASIAGGPSVFEYADSQRDSSGALFSVMKRAYLYRETGALIPWTGYKVGDLKQVYLGQVQTKPTLIGYIEGAPPLPSENLTLPPDGDYTSYFGASSVELSDAESQKVTLTSSREDGRHLAFNLKGGLAGEDEMLAGGPFIMKNIVSYEFTAGIAFGLSWSDSATKGAGTTAGMSNTRLNTLANRGVWEPAIPEKYLNGERRFLPANLGYALVRSSAADVYSLHLAGTGAMVSLSVVPNPDIPPDTNILFFPINPGYVKNGTLDGKVGLANDPQFPQADVQPGSYFKPVEAYSLKNRVDREASQLTAYYSQFKAAERGKASDSDLSGAIADNLVFDWSDGVPRKDMVNTYVWTATGGTYAEQESFTAIRQETEGGSYNFDWNLGAFGSLSIIFAGNLGFMLESDLMGGTSWTVTVQKDKEDEVGYGLTVAAEPTALLGKPDDTPGSDLPIPGKVDAYRFMTFYLAPVKKNFDDFFDTVVDRAWLETSSDTSAVALREARAASVGKAVWRILHRVTFVSRVPPRYQVLPSNTVPLPLAEPSNLEQNALLLELVAASLGSKTSPTPAEIGASLDRILSVGLEKMLPWWKDFFAAAQVPNTTESVAFTQIRSSAFAYIGQYYLARAASTL